jgi:hypothetical protein
MDAIECASILWTPLDAIVCPSIWEVERNRKSKLHITSIDDMLHPELIVTYDYYENHWEGLKVIHDILSPFKVWSLHHQECSLQTTCANRYVANIIPAKAKCLSHF